MFNQIDFPAKRAALMADLHEAENDRKRASLAQMVGHGDQETLSRCRDKIAAIKEQLEDLEGAEAQAQRETAISERQTRLLQRRSSAQKIVEAFATRRQAAALMDEALAAVAAQVEILADSESVIFSEAQEWRNSAINPSQNAWHVGEQLLNAFREDSRSMHVESFLQRSGIRTTGREDLRLHEGTGSIADLVANSEARLRSMIGPAVPELREMSDL